MVDISPLCLNLLNTIQTKKVICLAPMVRAGSLALRSQCLKYGADFVWTEEIVDKRIVKCRRLENPALQTVDFVVDKSTILLRTGQVLSLI